MYRTFKFSPYTAASQSWSRELSQSHKANLFVRFRDTKKGFTRNPQTFFQMEAAKDYKVEGV